MDIAFRVIWAADFNNAIRYYVRRPSGWSHQNSGHPLPHQNFKKTTDTYIVMGLTFGLLWLLISIVQLDFTFARLPLVTRRHNKILKT